MAGFSPLRESFFIKSSSRKTIEGRPGDVQSKSPCLMLINCHKGATWQSEELAELRLCRPSQAKYR